MVLTYTHSDFNSLRGDLAGLKPGFGDCYNRPMEMYRQWASAA